MVRNRAIDPGKSEGRNKLLDLFPEGRVFARPNKYGKPHVVFYELLQKLKATTPDIKRKKAKSVGISSKVEMEAEYEYVEDRRLFKDLVISLLFTIEHIYRTSKDKDKPLWIVVCCDKHEFISDARGIVHQRRASSKKPSDGLPLPEIKLGLEEPVPERWIEYLDDRDRWRNEILWFLIYNAVEKMPDLLDDTTMLIFDGHAFTIGAFQQYGWTQVIKQANLYQREEEYENRITYRTPLVFSGRSKGDNGPGRPNLVLNDWYENTIGESDYAPFFYIDRAKETHSNEEYIVVDIHGKDSDYLFGSIFYRAIEAQSKKKINQPKTIINILLRASTKKGENIEIVDTNGEKVASETWIQVNALEKAIQSHKKLKNLRIPSVVLITALLCAGSDYTERHYLVPHHHFLDVMCSCTEQIGQLVTFHEKGPIRFRLDGQAYGNLLCYAYAHARNNIFSSNLEDTYLTYEQVSSDLKRRYPDNEFYWFPEEEDVIYSALQMQYYLVFFGRLGEPQVDCIKDDLTLYGYAKSNPDEEMAYGNVKRLIHRACGNDGIHAGKRKQNPSPGLGLKKPHTPKKGEAVLYDRQTFL